ncbi:MAG: xanthine dehydrogenase family protein subunit M [Actinomycetota bacterium]|nr:xanthine dehydrogenase family protein subunit M [Actinomycetota bacterium]
MITAPFEYVRATSSAHALELLTEHGDDAKLLAGGHSLLPMMKLRLAAPAVLIDIARLPDLTGVRVDGDDLVLGACTPHSRVATSDLVLADAPLLAHSAGLVGDPQVRHRGTIGGSLVHADPAADLPMAVLALDARLVITGPSGTRIVAADEFFQGFFDTAVQPSEFLAEIRVPRRPGVGWGYEKFTRRANDWAIVAVATVAGRIALANMGSRPLRAAASERALASGAAPAAAAELADEGTSPTADMHATVEYRRHLARVLTRRALEASLA